MCPRGAYEGDVFQDALFMNPCSDQHTWINLRLKGQTANADAIGARLKITVRTKTGEKGVFYQTVSTGGSFGASSLQIEWGLGEATKIERLEVRWPNQNQTIDVYEEVPLNATILVKEGAEHLEVLPVKKITFES